MKLEGPDIILWALREPTLRAPKMSRGLNQETLQYGLTGWPTQGYAGWGLMQVLVFIWKPAVSYVCSKVSSQGHFFSMTTEKMRVVDNDRWINRKTDT